MSAVRMCDKCGKIFSENADGWSSYQGTRMGRDAATGRRTASVEMMDACNTCTGGTTIEPRLAVEATVVDPKD